MKEVFSVKRVNCKIELLRFMASLMIMDGHISSVITGGGGYIQTV